MHLEHINFVFNMIFKIVILQNSDFNDGYSKLNSYAKFLKMDQLALVIEDKAAKTHQ